jgi:hypothetical protein
MGKTLYITESQLAMLSEEKHKVTFFKFFTELKKFLADLLEDPIHAKPSAFFKEHDISRSKLINKLMDKDIISKKERIDEPNDADGKPKSMHYIKYKVPKKNFERKAKRLYAYFFEKNNDNENNVENEKDS